MPRSQAQLLLISSFNVDTFRAYLNNDDDAPQVEARAAPFGQVIPSLVEVGAAARGIPADFAVVWTQPESVIPSFRSVLDYQPVPVSRIAAEVDEYSRLLLRLPDKVRFVFVPSWVTPSYHRGYGMLEMRDGVANMLLRMNLRLAENLQAASDICLLNAQRWIEKSGQAAFSPQLWYMAKIAFGNDVFKAAVRDIKVALRGITGEARKLILVDLDNTLWGGLVGEEGWKNLNLGGHNAIGEAFVDFQRALKSFTNRGVLLGIVSKNTESVALHAIDNHPEMALRRDDFAGWKINWKDKAQNIVDLVSDLKLGLDSVVFIDDDPAERSRVGETLPEVLVPEWPENPMLYRSALLDLACFDTPRLSAEDRQRTQAYVSDRRRRHLRQTVGSLDAWLKTLRVKVVVEEFKEANLHRIAQLLNKTNQMNLSTRRMTETELVDWVRAKNRKLWTFRASDRFGDSGLAALVSLEADHAVGRIVDFVLSCRVIGRRIEETVLYVVSAYARRMRLREVSAQYIPTSKNRPCLDFFRRSGFACDGKQHRFTWRMQHEYPLPECIQVERPILTASTIDPLLRDGSI